VYRHFAVRLQLSSIPFWLLNLSFFSILPETLRAIVGNGSIPPPPLLRPIIPIVAGYKKGSPTRQDLKTKSIKKKFRNPFTLLLTPDIPLLLFFNGTVSAVFYAVTVSVSSVFVYAFSRHAIIHFTNFIYFEHSNRKIYPFLTQTEIGLCFLCIGGGSIVGSLISGKLLDLEYRRVSQAYFLAKSNGSEGGILDLKAAREDPDFPIESVRILSRDWSKSWLLWQARLRAVPYYMIFFVGGVIGYGWCIQEVTHISIPLILQFLRERAIRLYTISLLIFCTTVGLASILFVNAVQTVTVDLVPTQSSTVSACNNLFRGALGAVVVSVIDLMLNALTAGWTYVLLGGICAVLTPLVWVVIRIGPGCRKRRRDKEIREAEKAND
jgi:hypothetical protein